MASNQYPHHLNHPHSHNHSHHHPHSHHQQQHQQNHQHQQHHQPQLHTTNTKTTTNHHETLPTQETRRGRGGRAETTSLGGLPKTRAPKNAYSGSAGALRAPRGVALLLVVLSVLGTVVPGCALCEDRCERVVPMLSHLRALWSRSFKRVGEKRVSFEEFMVSLVQASSNTGHSRAHRLGNALMNLIGQYQDCVMACEHPFSKRNAQSPLLPPPSKQSSDPSLRHLCDRIYSKRHTSPLLQDLCVTYGP